MTIPTSLLQTRVHAVLDYSHFACRNFSHGRLSTKINVGANILASSWCTEQHSTCPKKRPPHKPFVFYRFIRYFVLDWFTSAVSSHDVRTNISEINYSIFIIRTYQWKICTRHQSTFESKTTVRLVVNHWLVSTRLNILDPSNASCLHSKQLKMKLKSMVFKFPCSYLPQLSLNLNNSFLMRLNFHELSRIKKSDNIRAQRFDVYMTSFSRYEILKFSGLMYTMRSVI